MRFFLSLISVLLFISASAFGADAGKDIITGSFSSPDRAKLRNIKLETFLRQDADTAMLLQRHRFDFDVKAAQGHYRSVLTRFVSEEDIPVVLQNVREVLPDAYIIASEKAGTSQTAPEEPVPAPASSAPAESAQNVVAVTSVSADEDIVVVDDTNDDAADEDRSETVMDNSSDTEADAADNSAVIPEAGDDIPAADAPAPTETVQDEPSYLMYGIIAAVAVLTLLLFVAMRKPARTEPLKSAEDEMPRSGERELRVPEIEAEEEENVPVAEEEPIVMEAPSETMEPEMPELPEIEMPVEEEAPAASGPEPLFETPVAEPHTAVVERKKRSLPPHPKTATKEDLTDFAGSRILVAEDNLINQKVLTKLLEGSGIEIVMADNGQIALDTLANDPAFDMILMDAHMPVKDGFEASGEIRADSRYDGIVIVALSGDVSSDDIRKMREAGMEEQLAKPLRVDALYNVMYQYLNFASDSQTEQESEGNVISVDNGDNGMTLNTATGLEICAGDKEMYAEILDEFVKTYGSSDTLFDTCLRDEDDVKLVQLALDIKGVAANIGAESLSEAAETLREAVLVNQKDAYGRLLGEFKSELHKLLGAIETFKSTL